MNVKSVLEAISSGDYLLELHVENVAQEDAFLLGAVSEKTNPSGFGRREFSFQGEQHNELLIGLAEIINAK